MATNTHQLTESLTAEESARTTWRGGATWSSQTFSSEKKNNNELGEAVMEICSCVFLNSVERHLRERLLGGRDLGDLRFEPQ